LFQTKERLLVSLAWLAAALAWSWMCKALHCAQVAIPWMGNVRMESTVCSFMVALKGVDAGWHHILSVQPWHVAGRYHKG